MPTSPLLTLSLLVLLALAVRGDLRRQRIPNGLTLGGTALGVVLHAFEHGSAGASTALTGALAAGLVLLPLWLLRGMGAGDVKLMAAVGAHLGPVLGVAASLATLIAGGVLALAVLLRRARHADAAARTPEPARAFAYAPAIAAGSLIAASMPLWHTLGT
ncbi:MAG: A24 family peptidase [Pseudomonadota bacterium]